MCDLKLFCYIGRVRDVKFSCYIGGIDDLTLSRKYDEKIFYILSNYDYVRTYDLPYSAKFDGGKFRWILNAQLRSLI